MTQSPRDPAPKAAPARSARLDMVTVVFVIMTVAVLAWIVLILNDPSSALNPLPPPTIAAVVQPPSLTPSPTASYTPTVTATFTPSNTPTITDTPTVTATPTDTITPTSTATEVFSGVPTALPTLDQPTPVSPIDDGSGGVVPGSGTVDANLTSARGTATRSPFPFTAETPRYEANTGDQGCQWLSIAGTVTDLYGRALPDLAIEINGDNFHSVQFSGSAARWGAAGFEFNLGAAPRTATYTLRVLGPTGGPISEVIYVETGNTCQRNITLVDFIQNHPY